MTKYANLTVDGQLLGFYDTEDGAPPPLEDSSYRLLEISDEIFSAWMADCSQVWINNQLQPAPVYVPTDEELLARLPAVSHAQIIAALVISEIITESEGIGWITGILPPTVDLMISSLPTEQQIIARLRAIRPTSVVPTDPLVTALGVIKGKSTADMIALFNLAASL